MGAVGRVDGSPAVGAVVSRAGLKVVSLGDRFYLMGGRTPNPPSFPPVPGDSVIWGDVWTSKDRGSTWNQLLASDEPGHWAPRAYFGAVTKGERHVRPRWPGLRGGRQRLPPFVPDCPPFVSRSTFFNDVWRSRDGVRWTQMTDHAPWAGRAGLSTVVLRDEIYVFGGSQNDDSAVIGGPPQRIYFNDVWKSRDGRTWKKLTDHAPWSPRAGAAAVTKGGYIYLLGGENGFVCEPLPFCTPPYFNDVWRTRDGVAWELVTPAAGWSPRPGHACVVAAFHIVCFGGFGLLQNPVDMWASFDGARWVQLPTPPWNATSPDRDQVRLRRPLRGRGDPRGAHGHLHVRGRSGDLRLHGPHQLPARRQRRLAIRTHPSVTQAGSSSRPSRVG